jgi:hypothetical protein
MVMSEHSHPLLEQLRRAFQFLTEGHPHEDESSLSDEFPVAAVDNSIVGRNGNLIATFPAPALAEDVAQRLNEGEWRRQEELWAL